MRQSAPFTTSDSERSRSVQRTIAALAEAGYRVIAPDQVGFCKSSKTDGYQYALAGLAHDTRGCSHRSGSSAAWAIRRAAYWRCATR